jgi:sodium/proline symporter
MSGWLLLGIPGYAYASGLEVVWITSGLFIGSWINWLLVAKRLRTYTITANNALTIPEYFAHRFDDSSKILATLSAFFILLFFLFYTSSGLVASGKLFATVFGMNYQAAVTFGAVCVVSYTLFGGFLAVSWTDLVQGLLMAAALMVVPVVAMDGSFTDLASSLDTLNPHLLSLFTDNKGVPLTAISIISLLAWGLGYFGQPHILARFNASRSNRELVTARRIAVSWTGLTMAGAILVGLAGLVTMTTSTTSQLEDSEKIFMILTNALFHPAVAGILLAAILAAIMSTADSQLLVSSSALAEDLYKQLFKPSASAQEVVLVGRLAVVFLALVALLLALNPESSVLGLVSYAWAGFGAAFGPVIIISLYFKGMNKFGAGAGIIVGGLTVVLWKQLSGGIFDTYEMLPGVILATIAIIAASLVTAPPSQGINDEFELFKENLADFE